MTAELPLEIRRSILESMITESKAVAFKITASAKAFTACGLTAQAESQAKSLVTQVEMTEALEKQLSELDL